LEKKNSANDASGFVEKMGVWFAQMGIPRMAGRIFGWLLICDPPHQTAQELAEAVGASMGSISTNTRLLLQYRIVDRIGLPGQRRTFFRVRPMAWAEMVRYEIEQVRSLKELAEQGLELFEKRGSSVKERLMEMRDINAFFEKEMPALLERLENHMKKK
jgi:DNA-binding transcriptional regulator GbsR (MarR family)